MHEGAYRRRNTLLVLSLFFISSDEYFSAYVRKAHNDWKLSISAFSKLFLTEAPGYERDSFLAAQAGGVGRMSR